VAGVDTVRGIAYQQAQAVLEALALLDDADADCIRVEGVDDVIDVEVLDAHGRTLSAKQIKVRSEGYTWGKSELLQVLRSWGDLQAADDAEFEFVTDGRLGHSGEAVRRALDAARVGDRGPLSFLVGQPPTSELCLRLSKSRIRIDKATVGALLQRAERRIKAGLTDFRTDAEACLAAEAAVHRLFVVLIESAGKPAALDRIVSRKEIARVLGVPPDQLPDQRWPGSLRGVYVASVAQTAIDRVVRQRFANPTSLSMVHQLGQQAFEALDVHAIVMGAPASILVGATGTGKTTACQLIARDAAGSDGVVVLAHAESYLSGRLDDLVADAVAEVVGRPMPTSTGRQVVADSSAVLVIDGASEISDSTRDALANELQAHVSRNRGVRVVLVGRDVAALRSMLPRRATPQVLTLAGLDRHQKIDLARIVLDDVSDLSGGGLAEAAIRAVVAQAESALASAADNPYLFTMAVMLIARGITFSNRAALYEAFIHDLAARTGARGITSTARVLGIAYAGLLDEARRYADSYEWSRIVEAAASPATNASEVQACAARTGLVQAVGIAGTMMPLHDSFADYLAAKAHAAGLKSLPQTLAEADKERVEFLAELAGVDRGLALIAVRDLPFVAVRIATHDRRSLTESTPAEVAEILRLLIPAEEKGVKLWRSQGRIVAFRTSDAPSHWLDDSSGRELLRRSPSLVATGGPLEIAVRLWRRTLLDGLSGPSTLGPPHLKSVGVTHLPSMSKRPLVRSQS
jgi:hypothetical protein